MHATMPYRDAFAPEQESQTTIAKTRTRRCQFRDAFPQAIVRLQLCRVTLCRSWLIDQPAGSAFAGAMHLPHLRNRRSLGLRAYHFFPTKSFNIVMSSA
jgi:hypothetical protein